MNANARSGNELLAEKKWQARTTGRLTCVHESNMKLGETQRKHNTHHHSAVTGAPPLLTTLVRNMRTVHEANCIPTNNGIAGWKTVGVTKLVRLIIDEKQWQEAKMQRMARASEPQHFANSELRALAFASEPY